MNLLFTAPSWLRQDEARIQKVTKRLHTLEEVNNNVKLLHEMLLHYSQEFSSEADKELMKVSCWELTHCSDCSAPGGWVGSCLSEDLLALGACSRRVKAVSVYTISIPRTNATNEKTVVFFSF